MTVIPILSKVPSQLIRLALKDLEDAEKDPRYTIDMEEWHRPWKGKCLICFAGAVMRGTLNLSRHCTLFPGSIEVNEKQLKVLNRLRLGYIEDAFDLLDIKDIAPADWDVPVYAKDREGFKRTMQQMAEYLEENGH